MQAGVSWKELHQGGIHAILVAAILIGVWPVTTHVTARAARLRETRGLVVLPSELPDDE